MDCIRVNGITARAFHGCIDEEGKAGGRFSVNVACYGDFKRAAETDEITYAVDYVTVSNIVLEQLAIRAKMIENVAYRIANTIREQIAVCEKVEVTLIKHRAPIERDVAEVSVTVTA